MTTFYKIRNKENPDQFIKGTPVYHSYDKNGRVFQSLGALRTFISNVMSNSYKSARLNEWEIVEIHMVVGEVKQLHDIVKPEKIIKLLKATNE